MNLRDLRYLIAVADKRHFGQAAELCNVSQPTLSAQLKKLETYLGVRIFERTNRAVTITPVGEEMVHHARLAVEQADAMLALAQARHAPLSGGLRLGIIPTLGPYLLPWIMAPLADRFPKLALTLDEDLTDNLIDKLSRWQIDAALVALPAGDQRFNNLAVFHEPFWLICPPNDDLAKGGAVGAKDLADIELLLLSEGHCLRDQALSVCNRTPRSGAGDLRAASLETLRQLVAAGYGCTLLPALALKETSHGKAPQGARPLNVPHADRTIGFIFRKSFPRRNDLTLLKDLLVSHLPNTVRAIA